MCYGKKLSNAGRYGVQGLEVAILKQWRKTSPGRWEDGWREIRSKDSTLSPWAQQTGLRGAVREAGGQPGECGALEAKWRERMKEEGMRNCVNSVAMIKGGKTETDLATWAHGQHWHDTFQWSRESKSLSLKREWMGREDLGTASTTIWEIVVLFFFYKKVNLVRCQAP